MGLLIFTCIVGIITCIILNIINFDGDDIFFVTVIAMFVSFALGMMISFAYETETIEEPVETVYIDALKDNAELSGNFFLGTGEIDSTEYYFYMEKNEKGNRMMKQEITNDVYVNDEFGGKPRLEIYDSTFTSPFARFMFGGIFSPQEYIFFVPDNTVTNEFEVDME